MFETHWKLFKGIVSRNKKYVVRLMTQLNEMLSSLYTEIALNSITDLKYIID